MSDHYTFITGIIFHNEEKADRIEKELKQKSDQFDIVYQRLKTPHGNSFFAGYFKNLGGGP